MSDNFDHLFGEVIRGQQFPADNSLTSDCDILARVFLVIAFLFFTLGPLLHIHGDATHREVSILLLGFLSCKMLIDHAHDCIAGLSSSVIINGLSKLKLLQSLDIMIPFIFSFLAVELVLELWEIFLIAHQFFISILIIITGSFLGVEDCHLVKVLRQIICAHYSMLADTFRQAFLVIASSRRDFTEIRHV
jgi:hypothetical protein